MKLKFAIAFLLALPTSASGHEGHSHTPSANAEQQIHRLNTEPPRHRFVVQRERAGDQTETAAIFEPFSEKVKVRSDRQYLYVESNGMPDHPMMIGITAWQQQVPLPQPYSGDNAWRIPLSPVPARKPMSARQNFFRGAIAIAVNGVPIFNPIKNDGRTDTLLAGELDQWGGHCGRADDYHYHVAPVHLETIVGKGSAIAVALDGYLVFGYNDPDGTPPTDLDWLNGHKGPEGTYHYHATRTYPYLNGGFYGQVTERGGQVDPQPRGQPLRPAARPLRGAKITGFETPKPGTYVVNYEVNGDKRSVEYTIQGDRSVRFTYVSSRGRSTETYTPRRPPRDRRPPPGRRPPR